MATTPKGIYYPNDYNEIADIPEDMKKMAESIDEVFENTDSDLSDIKEEQTTQNNRLNSLEVDNTTNKSDILTNKQEINNLKTEQTTQNNRLNNLETDNTTNKDNISANTQEINNIKSEQTTQNTNISTNATNIESLQEENDNLKKIVSQLPQVTGQGTSITLENTIEATFTKFDVEGNSTQETTDGYNMLNLEKYSYSESSSALNGGTVTIKDGVITLNATNATGNMTAVSIARIANADSIEAGTYYFGVDVYGAYESTPSTNIWQYKGNRTLTEKFLIKQWKFGVTQGNIASTPIIISNDTSKTTYEKYTNGASPNPNYEQPIESAGDNENIWNGEIERGAINGNGVDVDATNRVRNVGYYELNKGTYTLSYKGAEQSVVYIFNANKVKVNNPSWENGKSTFTLEENGYIKYALKQSDNREMNVNDVSEIKLEKGNKVTPYSPYGMGSINEKIKNKNLLPTDENDWEQGTILDETGESASTARIRTKKYYRIDNDIDYYISIKNNNYCFLNIQLYDKNKNWLNSYYNKFSTEINGTRSLSIKILSSVLANVYYMRVTLRKNDNTSNITPGEISDIKPMIEQSTTATDYVPHKEQDYSIFVQQPFRSNKDKTIKDKFVIKSDNKKYERHYIGEVILNGSENWNYEGGRFVLNFLISALDISGRQKVYSNYFEYLPSGSADYGIFVYKASSTNSQIYILDKDYTTVEEFKTWLSTHNVVVQYELAEPLDLPCTEEQIQQLENLPSTYKDFTIINSEDETPAYLEVSGIYDMNKLITRTEVLESES